MSGAKTNQSRYCFQSLFVFLAIIGFSRCLPAYEISSLDTLDKTKLSELDKLLEFSRELNSIEKTLGASDLLVKSETLKVPIPTAQISASENIKKDLQTQIVGDEGGSPYGPNYGKVTFGKVGADNSLSGLLNQKGGIPVETPKPSSMNQNQPAEMSEEEILAEQEQLEGLKDEMEKLATQQVPFEASDYKAYQSAKELFNKNEKLISKINEFDEGFVKNATELFVAHSWRDMDKIGKRPYSNFIEKTQSQVVFPDPTGKGTKLQTHRARISH